jgi:hypothetical protein
MADTNIDFRIIGTVAEDHKDAEPLTVFAAPATGTEFNTLGERLVPKACFKVEDILFGFGSSFIRPELKDHLPKLTKLRDEHKVQGLLPPLSIFGHTDPVGDDDFNKVLSGRRAIAFYAMLVRDVEIWESLFTPPVHDDNWGTRSIQTMLSTVQEPIEIDDTVGNETHAALRSFQEANGLAVDGTAGPTTRKALFLAYMDALCGPNLLLDKGTDFLGRNADPAGKGDFQGCSEFNPLLLFSEGEAAAFAAAGDKNRRNQENAPNRRVTILLFAPGRRVRPAVWPCPRASEGVAACKKRFFPDGDERRSFQAQRRTFEDTKNTFACRFYQLISDDSPCERVKPVSTISVFIRLEQSEADAVASPDRLVLSSSRGFLQERVVATDHTAAGVAREAVDIEFTSVPTVGRFTLTIIPPDGPYTLFINVPFEQLSNVGGDPLQLPDDEVDALSPNAVAGIDQPVDTSIA